METNTIERLVQTLGRGVISVATAPRGLAVTVHDVVVHDPVDHLEVKHGDLVLGVGLGAGPETVRAITDLASERCAGVVVKAVALSDPSVVQAAEDAGLALLTVPVGASWSQIMYLMQSVLSHGATVGDDVHGYAYVGYSDLDRSHPWTRGLYDRARQTYDPVGLGYPLLMERDQYWPCDFRGECDRSPTKNSSPIWSVARAAWEKAGGVTIGTVDPPRNRKAGAEGTDTNKTSIGVLKRGRGRIVFFGALLPQPSEAHEHWFGLNPHTITIAGQEMLLDALQTK